MTLLSDIRVELIVLLKKDILPLLLSPSPALQLHASNALVALHPPATDLPPTAQLRALLYAARWEAGIDPRDFSHYSMEGERWLVWAAGKVSYSSLTQAHTDGRHQGRRGTRRPATSASCPPELNTNEGV